MTVVLRNFSWRIILNRFYFDGRHNFTSTIQYLKACRELYCSTSLGNVPATFHCACICCDFVPATCLHYTSLLHIISACTTRFCRCNMSLQHDSLCLATFRLLRTKEKFILSVYFLGLGIMCTWNDNYTLFSLNITSI